jgi:cytoskeletal protein CcmA (bactofilin family)
MTNFKPEQKDVVYIGDGVAATGASSSLDTVVIDGKVDGEITCGHLVVGTAGVVIGEIVVSFADIYGK